MSDPEIRDIKCEWVQLAGAPSWMRHLKVQQTHGDNSATELLLTEKQAELVSQTYVARDGSQ